MFVLPLQRTYFMITIDISSETLTYSDCNKTYDYYFVDKSTNTLYRVISGGMGCLARSAGELQKLGLNKFNIKEVRKNVKSHSKYFKNQPNL